MRSIRRLSLLLGLLVLTAAACERVDLPTSPTAAAARPGVLDGTGGYTLLKTSTSQDTATVTAVLGSRGGALSVYGHTLTVPAGALTQPTRFTMSTVSGNAIQVALTAQDVRTGAPVLVFPAPLRLSLSYARARVSNPSRLILGWVVAGEVMGVQTSDVDRPSKTVSAWVYHFTQWAICD